MFNEDLPDSCGNCVGLSDVEPCAGRSEPLVHQLSSGFSRQFGITGRGDHVDVKLGEFAADGVADTAGLRLSPARLYGSFACRLCDQEREVSVQFLDARLPVMPRHTPSGSADHVDCADRAGLACKVGSGMDVVARWFELVAR